MRQGHLPQSIDRVAMRGRFRPARVPRHLLRRALAFTLLPLALFLASLLTASDARSADSVVVDKLVAVVGTKLIFRSEVLERARIVVKAKESQGESVSDRTTLERLRRAVLDQMIEATLIEDAAERMRIDVSEEEVDKAYERIRLNSNITEEQMREAVQKGGLSPTDYRAEIRLQLLEGKWLQIMSLRWPDLAKRPPPSGKSEPADPEAAVRAAEEALAAVRKRAVAELFKRAYVEVRW